MRLITHRVYGELTVGIISVPSRWYGIRSTCCDAKVQSIVDAMLELTSHDHTTRALGIISRQTWVELIPYSLETFCTYTVDCEERVLKKIDK
jgi:hypothetical protein